MHLETKLQPYPVGTWKAEHVIAFDWYDGVRQGVAQLSYPPCEFAFYLLDERCDPEGLDDRLFRISELPEGSVQSIVAYLRPLGEAVKPVWVPVWRFQQAADERQVTEEIDAILAQSRKSPIVVQTKDMVHFEGVWAVTEQGGDDGNWFTRLGIPTRLPDR